MLSVEYSASCISTIDGVDSPSLDMAVSTNGVAEICGVRNAISFLPSHISQHKAGVGGWQSRLA